MPSVEAASAASLLVVRDGERAWAVASAAVLSVDRLSDWSGEPPIDALELLGLGATAVNDARVVLVATGEQPVPLLARGSLGLLHPARDELLPLPLELQRTAPLLASVALVGGVPSVLVLAPERLAAAARAAHSGLSPSFPR